MDSNSTPTPTTTAPVTPTLTAPLLPLSTPSLESSNNQSGGNSWTQWAQQQLGNLWNSRSPDQQSAVSSQQAPVSSTTAVAPSSTASGQSSREEGNGQPAIDEHGFPTDEGYLREQGLNLVDLNREFVQQQEMQQELLAVLGDKTKREAFLDAFDQNNQTGNTSDSQQPAPTQRQSFPGGAPGQAQQPQSLEDTYRYLQELTQMGTPIDQLAYRDQKWAQLNEQNVMQLADTLIRGAY